MVAISFSIDKLIYRLLSGVKITTIRLLNQKWSKVLENFNEGKEITLQHYYKQRSKFSLKIIDTDLKYIERYKNCAKANKKSSKCSCNFCFLLHLVGVVSSCTNNIKARP